MSVATRWIGGLFACVLAPATMAQGEANAVARVDAYLAPLKTLSADFSHE